MSRITLFILCFLMATTAFAQDLALSGFNKRFSLVRNDDGGVKIIRLKNVVTQFSIKPFIEQIKQDLIRDQHSFLGLDEAQREAEIDEMLYDIGLDPYAFHDGDGAEEARRLKESLMNVRNINVEAAFKELFRDGGFWKEFEAKLHEAFLYIDPTILANLEDARFFYKKNVTHRVVTWALQQAKKRFSNLPILNIASFVIVRVHEMMHEQRGFHHNMLLHYFEVLSEEELQMTKEEVDRAVSSIYEYRIQAENIFESNRAARDWLNYGMNNYYMQVRSGNARLRSWQGPSSNMNFEEIKKLNFAFAQVKEGDARKIYHLHHNAHQFSGKPALAYDFSRPKVVKRNRSLLNLAGVALGFVNMPGWIKGSVENFINSFYVEQVRMEGALVGHFESTGNAPMIRSIYAQRANFYILE